ncbi:rhomboid family intramembrane serine protease [candidate division KSB1 bacterium]|nr:rhomboid family intramembrane serine protease [candidate division KSB1 bacterium]RQW05220.1 MAG: rhomboid family intramembrane serine protease [candidate division KSB1 bacterium]
MIPIHDDNPRKLFPFITIAIIVMNVGIFIYQLFLTRENYLAFLYNFGAIPDLIIHGERLQTILTSMFLHGGMLHLLGNMLYLWIFGDNIEGICGHIRFVLFYLICGLAAFFSHFIMGPFSNIPMVGASGAISGILGAYAVRFPQTRVRVLLPLFPFLWLWRTISLPAIFVLGFWFVMQILNALFSGGSGVAWFAHVGGFIAGVLLIRKFEKRRYRVYY